MNLKFFSWERKSFLEPFLFWKFQFWPEILQSLLIDVPFHFKHLQSTPFLNPDLNCMPSFYANWYPTRLLIKKFQNFFSQKVAVYRALNPLKLVLDLNCMPNFYANWYPTRLLPNLNLRLRLRLRLRWPNFFLSSATASATAQKVTFGRPLLYIP